MRRDRFNPAKNSSSGLDYFVKNNFNGSKCDWISLDVEIKTAVRAKCGEDGFRYLTTLWPDDVCDDPHFMVMAVLPTLEGVQHVQGEDPQNQGVMINIPVTAEMRRERRESNKERREHNESVKKMKAEIFEILASRVNSELNLQFQNHNGDPILCYRHLEFHYGPDSLGPQERGDGTI